jgi:nitrogen regulatory protein PII
MNTHPMKRVTVICEALAREPVLRLLTEVGIQGWTLWEVEGAGAWGRRTGDIPEFGNIQVEIILQPAAADRLLGDSGIAAVLKPTLDEITKTISRF